jgi:isopentenyldiphosphate isomerase
MEYFDLLDEEGKLTGEKKLRTEVHRDGNWHKAIHLWVINGHRELLLQKRAAIKDSYPSMWDTSIAGHIAAGSNSLLTAIKEASEELGIGLQHSEIEYLFTVTQRQILKEGKFLNNEFNDVYLVSRDVDLSTVKLQTEEVDEVRWVRFSELEKRVLADDISVVPHKDEYPKLFAVLHQRFDTSNNPL